MPIQDRNHNLALVLITFDRLQFELIVIRAAPMRSVPRPMIRSLDLGLMLKRFVTRRDSSAVLRKVCPAIAPWRLRQKYRRLPPHRRPKARACILRDTRQSAPSTCSYSEAGDLTAFWRAIRVTFRAASASVAFCVIAGTAWRFFDAFKDSAVKCGLR